MRKFKRRGAPCSALKATNGWPQLRWKIRKELLLAVVILRLGLGPATSVRKAKRVGANPYALKHGGNGVGCTATVHRSASFLGMDVSEQRFYVRFDGTLKHRLIHTSDIMFGGADGIFGSSLEPIMACTYICSSGRRSFFSDRKSVV